MLKPALMFSPPPLKKLTLASKRKARPQAMEITEMPPPSKTRIITKKPVYSKKNNPYKAIHKFKRTYNYGTISTAAATPTLTGFNFSMNDMPGYTELTALFDYYKLTGVLYKMIPYQQTTSNSVSAINNSFNAPIFYAVDYSDDTAPGSAEAILEYNDHKISTTFQGFSIYIPNPKSKASLTVNDRSNEDLPTLIDGNERMSVVNNVNLTFICLLLSSFVIF